MLHRAARGYVPQASLPSNRFGLGSLLGLAVEEPQALLGDAEVIDRPDLEGLGDGRRQPGEHFLLLEPAARKRAVEDALRPEAFQVGHPEAQQYAGPFG